MNLFTRNIKIYSIVLIAIFTFNQIAPAYANDAQLVEQDGSGQNVPAVDPDQQMYDRNFGETIGQIPAADVFENEGPLSAVEVTDETGNDIPVEPAMEVRCHALTPECGYSLPPISVNQVEVPEPLASQASQIIGQKPVKMTLTTVRLDCVQAGPGCGQSTSFYTFYDADGKVIGALEERPNTQTQTLVPVQIWKDGQNNILESNHQDSPQVAVMKDTIFRNLMATFGFTEEKLKELMRSGLITIKVDLENLTAQVTINPNVKAPAGALSLVDPLGSNQLPGSIDYKLGVAYSAVSHVCVVTALTDCGSPEANKTYYLEAATFQAGSSVYELGFIPEGYSKTPEAVFAGDNRLYSVKVFSANDRTLLQTISYDYQAYGSVVAHLVYQASASDVAARIFRFEKLEDGAYRVTTVTDLDDAGNVTVVNEFSYAPAPEVCEGAMCSMVPPLYSPGSLMHITRKNANGEIISTIKFPPSWTAALGGNTADILFPNGQSVQIKYGNFEELLDETAKYEELMKTLHEAAQVIGGLNGRDWFTMADVATMLQYQAQLKRMIEALSAKNRAEWIQKFNTYVSSIDQIVAAKELKVVLQDGREIIVRNPTQLFTGIIQRFNMMTQNGTIDLTRLAGIDDADVAGLESFRDYLAARKIGTQISVPLFDLFSPFGNLQLIERLVRKYADSAIARQEGPVTVVHEDFLRYIDGTKPVYDAAIAQARLIFANYPVHIPANPLTMESLRAVFAQLKALNQNLDAAMTALIDGFNGEAVFKNILRSDIQNALGSDQLFSPSYSRIWNNLMNFLNNADIVYVIDGRQVRISRAELDAFTNGLPGDSTNLLRYPGVQTDMPADFLNSLFQAADFNALASVNLFSNDASAASGVVYFSFIAKRFELLEQFLKVWGDEAIRANGTVDFDRLRLRLLISPALETELNNAEQYLQAKLAEMRAFAGRNPLSSADYAAMKELLKAVQEELAARFNPHLANVIYDTMNEVTQRVQQRYQLLVQEFSSVLGSVNIQVTMPDGTVIVINPREINEHVLQQILNATAIANYGQFSRSDYDRLNGIDADLLASLLSTEALNKLKNFSFNNYNSSWQSQNIALEEILFNLIPALIQRAGTADIAGLKAYVAQGVQLPVPLGQSLEATLRTLIQNLTVAVLNAIRNQPLNTIEDLIALRNIFKNYHSELSSQLAAFKDFLSSEDQALIEQFVNSAWYNYNFPWPNMSVVLSEFNNRINSITFLEIDGIRVPIRQILDIPNFPWSGNFDAELFANLLAQDAANTETNGGAAGYQIFSFNGSLSNANGFSLIGRIEFIANIVRRLAAAPDTVQILFTNGSNQSEVDPEKFRRHIKNVDAMQAALIAQAQALIQAAAAELERLRKGSYTIEEIEAMHAKVLALRQKLIDLLNETAAKHESRDVIEVENAISQIFQDQAFDLFAAIVGAAALTVTINGQTVVVPAKTITDLLIAYISAQNAGEIAAHSFASLYGISVADLRRAHKLENYLGEQIVAMPRNSQYVQIVSQLSEIGYMQLAVALIKRYAADVIKDGAVDAALLVQLATDKQRAVNQIKQDARAVLQAQIQALLAAAGSTLDLAALQKIIDIMKDAKIAWVSMMNDFLSGNSDEALETELQDFVNDLNTELKAVRDNILETKPFVYQVNGNNVSILLNRETLTRFTSALASWIAANPGNASAAQIYVELGELVSPKKITFAPEMEDYLDVVRPISIKPGFDIWLPYPRDDGYDAAHHPTEFGLLTLFARLAIKYGEFAVDSNGFNIELFFNELQLTDQSRAERRLQALLESELPALRNAIDALRDSDGALPVTSLASINELFKAIKDRITLLGNSANNKAQEVWGEFMDLYEEALFEGRLSAEVNGQRVTFDPKALNDLLMQLHREGKLDPALMAKFDEMLKKGEAGWTYDSFKTLSYFREWLGFDLVLNYGYLRGVESTATDEVVQDGGLTFGDLARIPGISGDDLRGLDSIEKDQSLQLSPADPLTLLGLLDMRSLAPGSGVDVGGLLNNGEAKAMNSMLTMDYVSDKVIRWIPEETSDVTTKSFRFIVFEFLPALFSEVPARVIENGTVNFANFSLFLQGKEIPEPPTVVVTPTPEPPINNLTVVTSYANSGARQNAIAELMEKIQRGEIAGIPDSNDEDEKKRKSMSMTSAVL